MISDLGLGIYRGEPLRPVSEAGIIRHVQCSTCQEHQIQATSRRRVPETPDWESRLVAGTITETEELFGNTWIYIKTVREANRSRLRLVPHCRVQHEGEEEL